MIMIIKVIEVAVVVKEVEVVPSNQEEASKIKNKLYANFLTNQEDAKKPREPLSSSKDHITTLP